MHRPTETTVPTEALEKLRGGIERDKPLQAWEWEVLVLGFLDAADRANGDDS